MGTKYTYSISTDFPNHAVATDRLAQEIRASAIVTALDYINSSGDACDVWFKDTLSGGDETILDGLVAAHSGEPLPDNTIVQVEAAHPFPTMKPAHPKLTLITPNWCDKTTWYEGSVYVEDEAVGDSGDHLRYDLDHPFVIDTYHGRVTFEDFLKDSSARSYRVVVTVNGVVKAEQDPHYGTGGDYTVNYAGGTVNFLAALDPADVVLVSYHYASSATFTLRPTAGKKLVISSVEVQFSDDLVMNDSVTFQAYGLVDVFAPQLMAPPYNLPSGTKIPLGDPLVYKTIGDLINDSNHAYPAYPAFGGGGWRGTKKATYVFAWEYNVGNTDLYSSMGMEIRVSLAHETPHGGAYATTTFYCTSEDESE